MFLLALPSLMNQILGRAMELVSHTMNFCCPEDCVFVLNNLSAHSWPLPGYMHIHLYFFSTKEHYKNDL